MQMTVYFSDSFNSAVPYIMGPVALLLCSVFCVRVK